MRRGRARHGGRLRLAKIEGWLGGRGRGFNLARDRNTRLVMMHRASASPVTHCTVELGKQPVEIDRTAWRLRLIESLNAIIAYGWFGMRPFVIPVHRHLLTLTVESGVEYTPAGPAGHTCTMNSRPWWGIFNYCPEGL